MVTPARFVASCNHCQTMSTNPRVRMAAATAGFLLFALVYYAPILFDFQAFAVPDSSARALLAAALAVPAVWVDLLLNLIGHLLPLVFCYTVVLWVARQVSEAIGLHIVVARLFFLMAMWTLIVSVNGLLFPLSSYSVLFDGAARPELATLTALVLGWGIALSLSRTVRLRRMTLSAGLIGIAGISLGASQWSHDSPEVTPARKNIVIVGIDSLSDQMTDAVLGKLPHLSVLLGHAERFERAYTPLARTFPAWASLLSGQSPAEHGALFNLRGLDKVRTDALLTRTLGRTGYWRVLAIDERRFSNLDESWGFDRVIGPKAGVLDFALQEINDTPLTNLLLQTVTARRLLSFSRLNVASVANYDADGFVDETLAAIHRKRPLFLAVHFESAHFPFRARHALQTFEDPNRFVAMQKSALSGVDAQIGRLMTGLRESGHLDDALVIVLSDHGESLGEVEAQTTRAGRSIEVSGYGHGMSLLSEHENRIVLGLVRFRDGRPVGPPSVRTDQVSLIDLRSVIERYARSGDVTLVAGSGCMMVETGVRLAAASSYRGLDVKEVAREAAGYYEIDSAGRMRLREDRLAALVTSKDVGRRCRDRLTYFSSTHGRYFAYRILRNGDELVETEPAADDIAHIDAYRDKLRKAARG